MSEEEPQTLSSEVVNKIYDILVEDCGAYEKDREYFTLSQMEERRTTEFRFCGKLGFGGKFWRNAGRWYVNAYTEDYTPAMQKIMDTANERLRLLQTTSRAW